MYRILSLLSFVWALALPTFAQSFTGSITGTVHDSSGAVVPQARVVIVNTAVNTHTEVRSDPSGNYSAISLQPGGYSLEVTVSGFKKYVRTGITLDVQQQAHIDVVLQVGDSAQSIEIAADTSSIETVSSAIGKVVDNKAIVNLPLNSRNVYNLIFLTPGVAGSIGNNYDGMTYAVNGARATMMDTLIDGVSASFSTVNGKSGVSIFPSIDAIAEFKVMGANYPAEFGRSQGSVLNVIFKSGTNQLHGSAYEFLRNSALDSNDFFANQKGIALGSFKRSQFGGTVSGPVRRDKTFFMASYEGLRARTYDSTNPTMPTDLQRQGDFSKTFAANGQTIAVYDPFTTRASGSAYIRDPFPGNKIPSARFDPVAVNVVKYYPVANIAGNSVTNANNYYAAGPHLTDIDQPDFRVDHSFTDQQKFFARYSYRLTQDVPPALFPSAQTIAEGRVNQENHAHGAVADYTNTLSPTTIVNGRLGFARTLFVYANQGLGFLPSSLGLPKTLDAAMDRAMFPGVTASGYASLGGNDHRRSAFMSYTALANVTRIIGSHSLKIGFEGRMIRSNVWEARDATFGFSAGFTQGPDPNKASSTAGNGFASLLLGTGTTGNSLIQAWKNVAAQSFYYAGYVQDDWKVSSKLTFNLGLRYDFETPRTERYNRMNYFDPTAPSPLAKAVPGLTGGVVFVGVNGNSRYQYHLDTNNLGPRLGLAYQLDSKTVIRAAYGHIFGTSPQSSQGTVGPFGFRTENPWVSTLDGITPYNLLSNPYPQGFLPPPGASQGVLTQAGANLQAPLQDTVTPWMMQWNFNVQRELPAKVLVEVAYVGTRGLQLAHGTESGMNINQLDPKNMALGSKLNDLVDNPFYGLVNNGVLASAKVARSQLLRPFPQFTTINPLFSSGASSTYHSLQVSANKRLSQGVQFQAAFTWAKGLDNGQSYQDSYNVNGERGLVDIDIAKRLVASFVYELPFGRGRHFGKNASSAVNWLLGGWQFNGITTFQTGTPIAISATNTTGIFTEAIRANNNGTSGRLDGPVDQRLNAYFDKTVFSQPAPFTFGNLSPRVSDIRNDGIRNFDLSMFKDFSPLERVRIQFRAEFLNAFNTPRFGGPNTTVTSSSFGIITSQANSPRQTQFGLKFLW
jgi:Carboxypeptidase regulatory-like domain/TonB dependent receptor